jgi:hypothetical protein
MCMNKNECRVTIRENHILCLAYQGLTSYVLHQASFYVYILKRTTYVTHMVRVGDPAGRRMISNRAFILFVRDNIGVNNFNVKSIILKLLRKPVENLSKNK